MMAFGDMVLFVFVAGFLSLAPTWFLQKLFVEKAPRALLATVPVIAAIGPVSWLAMTAMAVTTPEGGPSLANLPQATDSGDVARSFRDHVARCSDMMSPA
jgi:hypothetical protein